MSAPGCLRYERWISCAESPKRKFQELSLRDGTAKQISGECERKELAHQSIDHFLLEKSRDYGLITSAGFTQLELVYVCRLSLSLRAGDAEDGRRERAG